MIIKNNKKQKIILAIKLFNQNHKIFIEENKELLIKTI
jgi:hypothetical protein